MKIFKLLFPFLFVLLTFCQKEKPVKVDLNKTVDSVTMNKKNKTEIQIGVAAMLSPEEALPVYDSMIKYIGKKLGVKTKMIFSKDYSSMNKMVRTNKVVGAFVCAGPYASGHDKSIEAVAHKFVDGASVDQLIWEYMNKKHSPLTAATKIIKKIGPFCIPPFAVNSNIDKELFSKMRTILLNMNKDPEGSAI